jgi:hypothetical protein
MCQRGRAAIHGRLIKIGVLGGAFTRRSSTVRPAADVIRTGGCSS